MRNPDKRESRQPGQIALEQERQFLEAVRQPVTEANVDMKSPALLRARIQYLLRQRLDEETQSEIDFIEQALLSRE